MDTYPSTTDTVPTTPPLPPPPTPPSPQDTRRPSFSRSRSHQTLVDPARNFTSSARNPARPLLGLNIDGLSATQTSPASTPTSYSSTTTPSSAYGPSAGLGIGLSNSAFATMQRVYHAKDDIGFWSSLYSRHFIHTRQDATAPQPQPPTLLSVGSSGARPSSRGSSRINNNNSNNICHTDSQGTIRVWQVLTKSVLEDNQSQITQNTSSNLHRPPSSWNPHRHQQQQQQQLQLQQEQQRAVPHFERLPIMVQTPGTSLSSNGQPFSIVFFFTVEAAPATLWYLESAFTRTTTVHEHLELMGTFQPNDPTDPSSFYIYETHEFTTVQPTHEDTMLDILVQSPTGTVYAEYSYTFVKQPSHKKQGSISSLASSTVSLHQQQQQSSSSSSFLRSTAQNSNSFNNSHPNGGAVVARHESITEQQVPSLPSPRSQKPVSDEMHSPLDSFDLIDVGTPGVTSYFSSSITPARPQHQQQQVQPHQQTMLQRPHRQEERQSHVLERPSVLISEVDTKTISGSTTHDSIPTTIHSTFEDDDDEVGDDDDYEPEELMAESFVEEPDAGEHFMQATSEFFSKMGYWLSSSKVGQYIVRDDKIRTKTVFPTDDIWVLGVHYEFEGSDQTVSPPEPTRTRKTSALQIHTGPARGLGSKSSSLNGFGPAEARDSKHGSDRRRSHISSPRSMTDSEAISSFPSSLKSDKDPTRERHLDKQREKELAKARKLAKAHEREVEKEHERALEKERAVEKSRLKEKEKLEKLRLKISHPHFQKDVLENKHQGALLRPEPDRKSHSVHGYQFEGQSNSGISLAPPDFSEPKHSVIRRMRSISILPKVPTASDLKHAKKPSQESTSGVLPERGHQPRSQSVSSFSVFSHRSGASSSISSHSLDSPSRNRPNSPPIPSGLSSSISMHEVFASQSKTSSSSKTTQVEVSQKQLPNLPSFDDSSDLPYDNQQENDQAEYVEKDANKHQAPSATAGARPSKRRMTISGIFSKDAKPESTSSLATLKTLVAAGSNKIQAKVKEPGMVQALTQKVSFVSLSNKDSSSNSKKGVTKNVHHWLERRLSSHNLPQQIFVASTDVPVPPVSQDAVNSPPSSPLSPNVYKMPEERSDQKQTRTRKSSLNQSPTSTSPKSALKASSPLSSTSARFTEARERPSSPLGISGLNDIGETPSIAAFPKFNESETLVEEMISWTSLLGPAIRPTLDQSTESTQQSAGLPLSFAEGVSKVERPPVRPVNQRQHSSFADLVILPPLPPESPSEAFILLDKMKNASVTSLERSPDDSLFALPLMSGSMNTGQHSGLSAEKDDSSARSQATETDSDSFDVQNKRLFDRLAAFSNSKEESVSDLRTDWEALWPSKKSSQLTKEPETSGAGFVHIKEKEAPKAADPDEEEKQRRERIRKIGSAYLKVKAPTSDLASGYLNVVGATPASSAALQPLDIISPKPLHPMAQQQQPSNSGLGDSLTIVRTASPMQSPDLLHDRRTTSAPSSRESTLLLPVTADRASQPSPISTSSSLERSWKAITAISPRSISPRHTLPALPSSTTTTTSSRSASGMNSSLDIVGDDKKQENGSSRDSSISTKRPKSDELLSIPIISPTQASSLEKQESLSTSPSLSSIVDKLSPNQATLLKFLSDFQSRIWFTYRKDMARIEPAYYTSDAGWGCMMRTGQSLLAQAFVQLMLGREWRTDLAQTELNRQKYKTILSWFADEPDRYYSIHSIAKMGQVLDKRIGEWFGPSTMAHALRRLSEKHVNCPLTIMVPMDNSIRMSDIVNEASVAHGSSPPSLWGDFMSTLGSSGNNSSDKNGGQQTKWKPVVLLLPARFGLEKLTQKYISNLKKLFQLPQFLGIAGGRPGRSLYFVANQGSELFYFDPHFVKTRATPDELNQCPASSYHCQSVRTMEMLELDPSMMLGFLISSFTDLIDLSTRLKQEMEKAYPLLTLVVDVPIPTPAPEPEPAPEPIAIPIATPAQVASPSLAAMFAPISKSIPVAAPALSPISFSTPLTTPSFAAASVSAPGDVPTSASAPVSFQETVRTFIPVPVPGSALPRTITPVAAAVSSPASVLAPARSPTLTPARLATAVPLSSTTSTSLAVQESVPARASTPTPIHVSTPIPIRILTPRPTVTPEVTPIFAHVSAPVPGPESTSALVSSVSAPALGPVSTSKSFSETTQANTALKPEAFDVMVPAPVSAPAPVVAPVLVPVSTSTWLSWPEPEIDAPMSVPGPVLTPVSTRTLVPELEAIPISVPTPVATPVFTLTSNSTSISTLSTPVPEPEPETEPESKSGLASQLEFEAELELELPSEPVSVPVVAPAIASVVSPLVSPVISPVVVIPTTETITTAEDEMSEFVTRNSDEGRMGGEIVPGDTTILFVEAKGSMRVTHVEAVVDEDDDDDEEEKDAKENEDKEREEKDRSTVEEGPSSSSSLARPQLTLTESFASLEIASGDDNHEDGIIASDTLLSPPVPEQDDHGFASDTSLADISTTNTMAETQTLPAGQRRQTNKRAMKRITKALKKEKKLRSIESINALAQEQQQQQQQQQEQQQSLQHHHSHHHNIFHRKGHHSTKKAQQTEEERQRQAYDPYQYRYTSHDGDHVHDQETLSVKSLDSGDEDTLL